jgi:SAM-dependent methyltransferase
MPYLSHHDRLLFRFSHRARFRKAVELIDAKCNQTVLDYGCADGRLLEMLLPTDAKLFAYDPSSEMQRAVGRIDGIEVISDPSKLDSDSCDTIALLEVLEHVPESESDRILHECGRLLRPDGKLIVSVPIEVGPSVIVKGIARFFMVRPLETNMTVTNLLRSVFYRPINRLDYGKGIFGHMGFDYRITPIQLSSAGFTVEGKFFSPLGTLGGLLNSQVFFVAKPRAIIVVERSNGSSAQL